MTKQAIALSFIRPGSPAAARWQPPRAKTLRERMVLSSPVRFVGRACAIVAFCCTVLPILAAIVLLILFDERGTDITER